MSIHDFLTQFFFFRKFGTKATTQQHQLYVNRLVKSPSHKELVLYKEQLLAWGDRYKDDGWPPETPEYVVRYYGRHLERAERQDDLYELIDETWMHAHLRTLGSYEGFLNDVELATQVARQQAEQELAEGKRVSTLGLEVKFALCRATLASVMAKFPPSLLSLLVHCDKMSVRDALYRVRFIPDTITRLRARLSLLRKHSGKLDETQRSTITQDALNDLEQIHEANDEEIRCYLSLQLYPFLSNDEQIDEAVELSRSVYDDKWRVRLLGTLMGCYKDEEKQADLLMEVLQECSQISGLGGYFDQDFYPYMLESIASNYCAEHLEEALRKAFDLSAADNSTELSPAQERQQSESHGKIGALLTYLSPHIPRGKADLFLETCLAITYWGSLRSIEFIIIQLAPRLSQQGLSQAARYLMANRRSAFDGYIAGFSTLLSNAPATAMLVLSAHCGDTQAELRGAILAKISELLEAKTEETKIGHTLRILLAYALGDISDAGVAQELYTDNARIDQVRDHGVFCMLEPLSMKAVVEQMPKQHDLDRDAQELRTSPYYYAAVAERLANQDLHLFMSLARDGHWMDGERWSLLRAIARVAHRIPNAEVEARIAYAIDSLGRNTDATIESLMTLAPRMERVSWQTLIDEARDQCKWEYWLPLEEIIQNAHPTIVETILSDLMQTYVDQQQMNLGQMLSEMALRLPAERASPVAEKLQQFTLAIYDLPKQFEILESLHLRNWWYTHHWKRNVAQRAQAELARQGTSIDYQLQIVRYSPVWKRVAFYQQLRQEEKELQLGGIDIPVGFGAALWQGLTDSVWLRKVVSTLLLPVIIPFARLLPEITRSTQEARQEMWEAAGQNLARVNQAAVFNVKPGVTTSRRVSDYRLPTENVAKGIKSDLIDAYQTLGPKPTGPDPRRANTSVCRRSSRDIPEEEVHRALGLDKPGRAAEVRRALNRKRRPSS